MFYTIFGTTKKIIRDLLRQSKERGLLVALIMNISNLKAFIRALFYKFLYFKNIKSSIFFMQQNSKIEIFNKRAYVNIGRFVYIRKNASFRIDYKGLLILEDNVFINDNCTINCVNRIVIGAKTKIAPNVSINDHNHNYKNNNNEHLKTGEVYIGKNVWIGANVVILKDTWIGDNSVIAAGSIVKGIIPKNTVFLNEKNNKFVNFDQEAVGP